MQLTLLLVIILLWRVIYLHKMVLIYKSQFDYICEALKEEPIFVYVYLSARYAYMTVTVDRGQP
jgi:hypothetical protein